LDQGEPQPPSYQWEKEVWFKVICINCQECDQLTNEMHQNAYQFSDFHIRFSLASQSSQTKQTVIRVENILQGGMTSKLNEQFPQELILPLSRPTMNSSSYKNLPPTF